MPLCRVEESNEDNNWLSKDVVLPAYDIVTEEPPTEEPPTEEPPTEEPPTVEPNSPPSVQIVVPVGRSASYQGYDGVDYYTEEFPIPYKFVSLQVVTDDAEDGTLSDSSIVWSTNRTDIVLQTGSSGVGQSVRAKLYAEACYEEAHIITVVVTDSGGLRATDSVTIYLNTGCGA